MKQQKVSPADRIVAVHIEEEVLDLPYTREILARCPGLPQNVLPNRQSPDIPAGPWPENVTNGKRHLFLCRNRGAFFKPCPGTREYQCCDYQVLNVGMNCPMDCVYCILQAYLNNPWISFFVNVDDLLAELDCAFAKPETGFFRIGTGEFTDSLALDRITGLSPILVEYMGKQSGAVLELKTKTAEIENLEGLSHNNRTIVAWSVNSPQIMEKEELFTATFAERLQAARTCADWGYRIAFHFDPVVLHPGWEEGYLQTIDRLFASIPKDRIAWISLGGLRFLPALKNVAQARFAGSRIFSEEFVPGLDGKSRYFREVRVGMYKVLVERIMTLKAPSTCLYMCMESDEIWSEVFGYIPGDHGGLATMLDLAVQNTS